MRCLPKGVGLDINVNFLKPKSVCVPLNLLGKDGCCRYANMEYLAFTSSVDFTYLGYFLLL